MNDKSYVTMEQKICLVCTKKFDTNNLLLDTHLRNTFERHTVTGWDLCPEHQKLYDEGYIALVAANKSKSEKLPNGNIKDPGDAYRTGAVVHIRRSVWPGIFNSPIPMNDKGKPMPMAFCDPQVIETLQKIPMRDDTK